MSDAPNPGHIMQVGTRLPGLEGFSGVSPRSARIFKKGAVTEGNYMNQRNDCPQTRGKTTHAKETVAAVSIASAFVLACSIDAAEGTKTDAPSSSTVTISGWVGDFSGWGRITNRPSLAGARVCADLKKTSQCVATDAAGKFQIEGAPLDSTVEVTVIANGFLNASESIHTSKSSGYGEAHLIPRGSVPPDAASDTGMLLVRIINPANIRRISAVAAGTIGGVEPLYTNEEGRFDATFAETGADGLALYVLPPGPIAISAAQIALSDCGFSSDGWVTSAITANVVAGTVRTVNVLCGPVVAATLE